MADVTNLNLERARKFLDRLSEDPFLCVVMTDDGDDPKIQIFSKGIEADHVARLNQALKEIERG